MKKITSVVIIAVAIATIIFAIKSEKQKPDVNPKLVEKIRKVALEIDKNCTMKNPTCYQSHIQSKLLAHYPTETVLMAINDYDQYFSCHAFTHFLGRALYQKTQSIPDAYSQINFTCHGGAYHGVIESYLNDRPEYLISFTGEQIENICQGSFSKANNKNPEAIKNECLHGFGHAFMYVTTSDLPKSLSLCDRLKDEFQERCFGGAFMENSTSSTNRDHPTNWLKAGDKFFPCTILEEKYLNQCYFYQANYLVMSTDHNFKGVFSDCYTLQGIRRDYCHMGVGAILASVTNERGVDFSSTVCDLAEGRARQLCIEGAVPSMLQRWGGDTKKIVEFCNLTAADLREVCFLKLGTVAKYWYKDESIENICKNIGNYQEACMGKSEIKLMY